MLKVGLIGLGFMGRAHLSYYERLEKEGAPVCLVALCDVDPVRLEGCDIVSGNIDAGNSFDGARYHLYADYHKMIAEESLDIVDIALPTYLHAEAAITAMKAGLHVLSEKPMARTADQCLQMAEASKKYGKRLMVAQCLRFWPAYEYLKDCVASGRFGEMVSAYFFRGGVTPTWSWNNWLLDYHLSGGCLLDQHVHDVDAVHWLFGLPLAVSSNGRNVIAGSGYDAVSTRYLYPDGKFVCAEDDWTINGDFGFNMLYRVNFERGSVHFSEGKLKVHPADGQGFEPDLPADDGYYREISYFIDCVRENRPPERCLPASTADTIRIALAEQRSADGNGIWIQM